MTFTRAGFVRFVVVAAVAAIVAMPAFATTVISPTGDGGLESGADFPTNGWTVVNGANNRWFVGTAAVASAGTNSAFTGPTSSSWAGEAVANVNHIYRDVTFPPGEGVINLSFKYKIITPDVGNFDFLKVFLVPTSTTPVAGTQLVSGQLGALLESATSYTTINVSIPGSAAGTTQRLVFSWRTEGSAPNAAVSVDEISLTSAAGTVSGTKTICPSGCDFATLTAAFANINTNGLAGPVVLELQPTYVSTSETFPLAPGALTASSATNTVTVRPSSGASALSISTSNTTATIDLNGTSFLTFDGQPGGTGGTKQLTIANTSTLGTAVRFINDATNDTVKFCTVTGVNTSTTNGVIFFTTTTGAGGNDNNTISNNDIRDGATTPANGIYSSGTTTTAAQNNSGNTISSNNIFNFFSAGSAENGILLSSGNTDWTITGNSLYQTATRTETTSATESGITISNSSGNNFVVSNNFIGGGAASAGGTAWTIGGTVANRFRGISLSVGTTTPSSVQNNTIANFNFTSSSASTTVGGPWVGIYLSAGSANIGTTTGNTIGSGTGTGSVLSTISTTGGISSGITSESSGTTIAISNNTIGSITAAGSTTSVSHGFTGIVSTLGTTVTINGNTIGSTTTANSINASTASTSSTTQVVTGISVSGGTTISTTNNTIANLNNAYVPSVAGTSRVVGGIVTSSGANTITGNTVRNLSTAANATGTSSSASVVGIANTTATAPLTISSNTIRSLSNTNSTAATIVTGILNNGPTTGTNVIAKNLVHTLTSSSTAGIVNGVNVTGGTSTYQNNMIDLGVGLATSAQINGINETGGTDNFFHNSVYVGGTGVASGAVNTFAFNSTVTTNTRSYRDNVLFNARSNASGTGVHYAIQVGGTTPNPSGLTTNNNVLFANGTGGAVGRFNAATQATLANWQSATGQDGISFSSDPIFLDPTNATPDLHINPSVTTVVEGNGVDVGVTDDFDSQTRSGLTPVDIGADAGLFTGVDLTPPAISYTALTNGANTTSRTFTISVTDLSGVPTAGAGLPVLYFRKGVAGAYAASQCSFVSGSSYSCTFTYAAVGGVVVTDTIQYFVAAQDGASTPNVTTNPSGGSGFTANPPAASTPPASPNSFTIVNGIGGTKTVCASGCDYTTLTGAGGAFSAINGAALTGNLSVEIAGDLVVGEDGSVALNAPSEDPSGSNYTIKIYPTGVARAITSTTLPSGGFLRLNAADRVTIDGSINGTGTDRSLTVTESNTALTTAVIWLQSSGADGAQSNTIKNLNVVGQGTATTLIGIGMGGSTVGTSSLGSNNNNNTIQNNSISKLQFGIYTQGASAGAKNTGNVITQNTMTAASPNNVKRAGVLVGFENGIQITRNSVGEIASSASSEDVFGISLGTTTISTGTFTGNEVTNALVSRNSIGTVRQTATYSACGIFVAPATSGTNEISNNVMTGVSANATSGDFTAGILIGGGAGSTTRIYFNSVSMNSAIANTGGSDKSYALAIGGSDPTVDVRDNVLYNTQNNGTGNNYAIGLGYATFANLTSNFNDFFITTGATFFVGGTGSLSAPTSQLALSNLQTATGKDASSIQADPQFNSPSSNLTPQTGSPVIDTGTSLAAVVSPYVDFTGATRVDPPSMGAYESAADTAGPAISYTALGNTTSTGNRTLSITVTDPSGVPTSGTGLPVIYFRKGISGSYASTQCSFVSGSGYSCLIDVSLVAGGGVTTGDTVQYYVAAQDTPGNVSVSPSAGASGLSANPPAASTPPTSPSSYQILAAIGGTKSVCASGCDYTSLTGAGGVFSAINAAVATTNLQIQITGDLTVGEDGTVGLNAIAEDPSGSNFTVSIYPTGAPRAITGSATGALIKLNGADRVTIDGSLNGTGTDKSLTITNTSTGTASAVIGLQSPTASDGATSNTVKNLILSGNATTTTFAGVFVGGTTIGTSGNALTANSSNTIRGNQIGKAQYGIYAVGVSTTTLDQSLTVQANAVGVAGSGNGTSIGGVVARFQQGATIDGNDVQNVSGSGSTNLSAIQLQDSKSSTVSANKLHGVSYTGTSTTKIYALYSGSATISAVGNPSNNLYANNAIYDVTSACTSGVWCMSGINNEGGYGDKYYFNSVSLSGTLTGAASGNSVAAFSIGTPSVAAASTSGGFDVRDNVFSVTGTSSATITVYAHETSLTSYAATTLNYNDLYVATTGTVTAKVGRINATDSTDLTAWRTATGQEANSISANPLFNSATNLTPQTGSPVVDAGISLSGAVSPYVDITGATRVDPPSMGAYEVAADTVGPVVSYTAFGNTTSTSNRTLTITATDASGVPTSGTGLPAIYFRKGTSGAYASSQCSFVSGSSYSCLVNYALVSGGSVSAGDTVQYYVAAQDNAGNVSVQPSAGASGFTANPPAASTPPTSPSSYLIAVAIGGTRTVCPSGCDYATLTGATGVFNAINNAVVTANVAIEIAGDLIAGEDGSVALNPLQEEPTGSNFTVHIYPTGAARAITSTTTPSGGFLRLNAADRVTIDGSIGGTGTDRSLTVTEAATGTTTAVVWLQSNGADGATSNTIKNLNVVGNSTATTLIGIGMGATGTSSVSATSLGSNNNINTIQNNNISKAQYGIYSQGASAAAKNTGNVITQNSINTASPNQVAKGILVGFENAVTISDNVVSNLSGSLTSYAWGISLGLTDTTYLTTTGNEVTNGTVTRNIVGSVRGSNTFGVSGIAVASAASGTTVITNNVVYDATSNPTEGDIAAGIYIGGGAGSTQVYFNSVTMAGTFTGSDYPSYAIAINGSNPIVNMRDNVFTCTGSTGANLNRAIGLAYSTFTNLTSDFNDLFVSGTSAAIGQTGTLDNFGFTSSTTIANWRTNTAKDTNSISLDPLFNSATNLQPQNGSPVLDAGTSLSGVVTPYVDILNLTRVDPPSMGAYETSADVTGPSIVYTALGNTTSTANRTLVATITDPSGVGAGGPAGARAPHIYYRKGTSGTYVSATGSKSGNNYTFTVNYASVGGVVAGDLIQYYVAAQDNVLPVPNVSTNPAGGSGITPPGSTAPASPASYSILVTVSSFPYCQNFEAGAPGWTTGVVTGTANDWTIGTPAKTQITAAHTGSKAYVTKVTGSYATDQDSYVQSPSLNFTSLGSDPTLFFWQNFKTEEGYDAGILEVSTDGGVVWNKLDPNLGTGGTFNTANSTGWYNSSSANGLVVPPKWSDTSTLYTGAAGGWINSTSVLAGLAGQADVRFRWRFGSDDIVTDEGWALDDICVSANEVTPPSITYTPLGNTTSTGSRTLSISVTDASGVPTSGAGLPVVYFRKGTSGAYTGSQCAFLTGSSYDCPIDPALVGGVSSGDTIQYYVAAQDNFTNVTTNPATGASGFTANPPAASIPTTAPSSYAIAAQLSGTYTVGTGGTYTSLTNAGGAFEAINNGVVTGNVTLTITSDLSAESGAVALNQWVEESGSGFTLTIKPSGAARAVTSTALATAFIKLNGADRVTIDGSLTGGTDRSLTFTHLNPSTSGSVIWIASASASNGAGSDTVKNCNVAGASSTTTFAGIVSGSGTTLGGLAEAQNSNNTFQNNAITATQYGIVLVGPTGNESGALILGNTIGSTVAGAKIGLRGIGLNQQASATVTGNSILGVVTATSSTASGIKIAGTANGILVQGNQIRDVKNTNTGGWGSNGISLGATNTGAAVTVFNNFIWDVQSQGFAGTAEADNGYGIVVASGGGYSLYANSINLATNQVATDGITAAVNVLPAVTAAGAIDLRDNILVNTETVGTRYAIYSAAPASVFSSINYNDYFSANVGFLGGTQTTLASWKIATGQDASSVSGDPLYVSSTNLHINTTGAPSPVENAGTFLAAVTTDIDGDLRNTLTPDIGADEVDRCASVTCPGATTCATFACDPTDGICKPTYAPPSTECRASAGTCDLAETCTGSSATCPADAFQPSSLECRGSAGACDLAETCTGSSALCPSDSKSTAECRGSAGSCDVAESCNGTDDSCPADALQPSSFECRGAAGACDLAESCTGSSALCPTDGKSTAECRGSAGICDVAESCTGLDNDCPADAFEPSTTECRASTASCDPAESCTGSAASCPSDVVNAGVAVGFGVTASHHKPSGVTTVSWTEVDPGPFNVYRGSKSPIGAFDYNQGCIANNVSGSSATDNLTPAPGAFFYYLVSRNDPFCQESSLGMDSNGDEEPNYNPCPSPGSDADSDTVVDALDNCPAVSNTGQVDVDGDGHGDVCDNCPSVFNSYQQDADGDTIGDLCDPDIDNDGEPNGTDNCPYHANPDQADSDFDGIGDVCDPTP